MYRLITEPDDEIKQSQNPIINANFLEIFTFSWLFSLFKRGQHRDLEENDTYAVLDDHKSSLLGNDLENLWRLEVKKANEVHRNPSLLRVLIQMFGAEYTFCGFLMFLNEMILKLSRPILIGELLEYFSNSSFEKGDMTYACICAFSLVICLLLSVFLHHQNSTYILHCSMKTRVACSSIIYRKALCMSNSASNEASVGHIINLLSNDVNKFDTSLSYLHSLWIGPLQAILVTYLLWLEIGIPSLIGASTFFFFIPLQATLGNIVAKLRMKLIKKTDERVHLMNEIISGIQFIKMYTWEKSFTKLIEYARKKEISYLKDSSYIKATLSSFTLIQTRIQLFIIVISYVLLGNHLSSKKVFIVLAYYNLLGTTVVLNFGRAIIGIAELKISINRLQHFLLLGEKEFISTDHFIPVNSPNKDDNELDVIKKETENNTEQSIGDIIISNATAKWSPAQTSNSIENIKLNIERGQLIAVIGPVGAGKSSLLQAILKELPLSKGKITVRGAISYASQEPWLFSGSIKQNIIFDSPLDHDRYEQVISACALNSDFKQFPHGDKTIVGERGVILSGGQRARINLARSVYRRADIYLLDDPLSAVDTKVGKHLFEKCIKGFLIGKTCVLITHQTQYLTNVDQIVVINEANLSVKGSFQEVIASGIDFAKLLTISENADESNIEVEKNSFSGISSTSDHNSIVSSSSSDEKSPADGNLEIPNGELETPSSGRVQKSVYSSYLSSGGSIFKIVLWILMYSLFQIIFTSGDYWISTWVTDEETIYHQTDNIPMYNKTSITPGIISEFMPYLNIRQSYGVVYSFLIISLVVSMFISSSMFVSIHSRSSINLHNMMFNSIIKATMYFFNTNPSGRILNRFSSDLGTVDEMLPSIILEFIRFTLTLLGILFLILLANIYLIIPAIVIGVIFYYIINFFLKTSQSIKRLEGIKRSPIISHINESLQGLSTIRAYKAEQILCKQFDKYQDLHSSAWYILFFSNSGFGFWVDIFCLIYIGFIILSFVTIGKFTNGGLVGLAITQTIRLLGMFQLLIRQFVRLEVEITSVERVLEYINCPQELTPQINLGKVPPKEWPTSGEITFQDFNLRYSTNGKYVLKNLCFKVNATEKVGIVGRTGAGKSSIVRALFRLALNEGIITVDGIDIHELELQDVRSRFSIIPQEPVLFSGTLRTNLDPYDQFPDHVLWNALDKVELKDVIESLPNGLNSKMSENGSNFSVGQRQLVCLARAIVRDNKILVLDEATANVDTQTDALIQKSIRSIFKMCTVITIAHRLNTVMDSDRVLVLDAGTVVEFDHPHSLLKNKDGVFYSMVKETGPDTADLLHAVAAESFKAKQI